MTFEELRQNMRDYNNVVAYGSECNAWQDFVADCKECFDHAPWDDDHLEEEIGDEYFVEYWMEVANGKSSEYDPDTGAAINP